MRRTFCGLVFLGVACCVAIVGCGPPGPKTVPVTGTLTIDGQPADHIVITLTPVEDTNLPVATGNVTNGSFELYSGIQGEAGAVPGKYKVMLAASAETSKEAAMARYSSGAKTNVAPDADAKKSLPFATKYASSATSDKEVEITKGKNDLKIDVSSK